MANSLAQVLQQGKTKSQLAGNLSISQRGQLDECLPFIHPVERAAPKLQLKSQLFATSATAGQNSIAGAKFDGVQNEAPRGQGEQLGVAAHHTPQTPKLERNAAFRGDFRDFSQGRLQDIGEPTIAQRYHLQACFDPR